MNLNLSQTHSEQQGRGTLFKVAALAKTVPQGMDCTGIHRVDRQLAEPSALLTVRCFSRDYRRWYERCKSNYFRKWKHKRFHFSSWHPNDILSEPAKPSTSSSAWIRLWGSLMPLELSGRTFNVKVYCRDQTCIFSIWRCFCWLK